MKIYEEITVDLTNPYPLPKMKAQQGNTGRGAKIKLTHRRATIQIDKEIVNLYAKLPNSMKMVYLSTKIEDGLIVADFSNVMLSKVGNVQVELQIIENEQEGATQITTPIFIVDVKPSNIDEGKIVASSEFSALVDALADVQEYKANGLKGDKGNSATINVGTVETLEPNQKAVVTNSGTIHDAILNFGIPKGEKGLQGEKGDKGDSATIQVGTVETLEPNQKLIVENVGTVHDAVFNFGIPKGEKGESDYKPAVDALEKRLDNLKSDLVDLHNRAEKIDGVISIDSNLFDIGTMGISSTKWSYYSSQYRVRTKPNTSLHFSKGTTLSLSDYANYRFIISYERNKGVSGDYISSGWLQKDFVCPLDSNYVLMIARLTDTVPVTDVSELLGLLTIKKGESYIVTLTNRISNNEADIEELQNHIFNPSTGRMPTLYIVDGESLPIYANSFVDSVSDWHDAYKGMSMASGGISDVKYFNNGMLVKGDINDGYNNPHPCNIAFVNANETTKSSSVPIKVVSSTISGNKKVLCIGDSLTYGGKYLAQYRQLYKDDVLNIDFVGTIGQGTDASPLREGRSQWNTKAYCTQSSFAGATNAFINPSTNKFDFPYYCSHNNINPDIVCIFLGTNELTVQVSGSYPTLAESEQYYAEMIASIREYSATIPIVVWWCPIPCQINGGGGVTMGKKNRMDVGDMLRRNYVTISGTEYVSVNGVYILPIYAIISDSDYTINDIVLSDAETVKSCADSLHLTDVGHKKIAIALHGMLKYLASI